MRIWFNRGFSLAPIAKAMMAADPTLEVIVSVERGMPAYEGPSQTWTEPAGDKSAYLEWARAQIEEQRIDVFVPTRHRDLFAGAAMPCAVHLPATPETLWLLEDKHLFAAALGAEPFHLPTMAAASSGELRQLLDRFEAESAEINPCVKPRFGVNGHGFWELTSTNPLSHLLDPDARKIRRDIFLSALEAEEQDRPIKPLVLMEYLPGPEVSLDVLAHHGEILKYVARTKQGQKQRLQTSHPLEAHARSLVSRFALHGVINIQFRRAHDGSWKILEINARPAGGSVYAEQFGASLLGDWGGILSGRLAPEEVSRPDLDIKVEMSTALRQVSLEPAL